MRDLYSVVRDDSRQGAQAFNVIVTVMAMAMARAGLRLVACSFSSHFFFKKKKLCVLVLHRDSVRSKLMYGGTMGQLGLPLACLVSHPLFAGCRRQLRGSTDESIFFMCR